MANKYEDALSWLNHIGQMSEEHEVDLLTAIEVDFKHNDGCGALASNFETIKIALQEKINDGWLTDPALANDGDMVNLLWADDTVRVGYKGTDIEYPECDFISKQGMAFGDVIAFQVITLPTPPEETS
tara:strand:- start:5175 stop:5558 length:384 start_codon:yes stop_codon:yes gene_type:complete